MRLLRILVRLRQRAREFFNLEPLATFVEEPALPPPAEEPPTADKMGEEFQQLLLELGAENQPPDYAVELAKRDGTIAELQTMLNGLRGLGDMLAETENLRLAAEKRSQELEAELARTTEELTQAWQELAGLPGPDERHQRELARREAVLANERERHAATREKLAERKRVAAERWRENQQLRSEVRRLEQALAEARSAQAPALPGAMPASEQTPLASLMHPDPAQGSGSATPKHA